MNPQFRIPDSRPLRPPYMRPQPSCDASLRHQAARAQTQPSPELPRKVTNAPRPVLPPIFPIQTGATILPPARPLQPGAPVPAPASRTQTDTAALLPAPPVKPGTAVLPLTPPAQTGTATPPPPVEKTGQRAAEPKDFNMRQLIDHCRGLAGPAAILGICADRLPVLFDFTDPRPGPLAVIANPRSGKTALIQTILETALSRDLSQSLRFLVISSRPEEYRRFTNLPFKAEQCLGVFKPDSAEAAGALNDFVASIEYRRQGVEQARPLLVILDDLTFLRGASFELKTSIESLLKNGPAVQIWPLAAIASAQALESGRWLRHFHTRLIGNMANATAARLGAFAGVDSEGLIPRRQFAVYLGGKWLSFWIPRSSE